MAELKPCPFCRCAMRVNSNRDWHVPVGMHDDGCLLVDSDFKFPANDAGRADLVATWNRRATDGQRDTARGVPEGWKLVPVEPIMEMVAAADAAYRRSKRLLGAANAIPAAIGAAIAAAPTPPDGDAGRPEPYVEVTVRVGDAIARQVGAKVAFERTYRQWDWLELLARQAINDAMAASKESDDGR